jgi:NAD+ diphosphatase
MAIAFENTFAGSTLDRAGARRGDRDWISAQLAASDAVALALWQGKLLATDTGLARLPLSALPAAEPDGETLLFLGLQGTTPVFAINLEGEADPAQVALAGLGAFDELRPLALRLSATDAAEAAAARSLFEWRRRHRWCANCGAPTRNAEAGWKRVCPVCGAEHFPRTDPVVIMMATFGDRCLLGRQAAWAPGMWSALAGFVEPGESLEEAVARELREEASLTVTAARYHSSQPWPFPGQMMVGFIAQVADDQAKADLTELEAVRWFDRAQAAALLRGEIDGAFAPPPLAIAHQLIKAWVAEGT